MTRRAYIVLAALGLAGLTVLGVLNARHDRALRGYDWGAEVQGPAGTANFMVNMVRVVSPFDADARRFAYYTGAYAPGSGEEVAWAPRSVIAEGAHGSVTVRMRAFAPYSRERAGDEAAEIARMVSLATTRVWPGEPTVVEIDVHFMPKDARFSLAKRIEWREGDPFEIAVFAREDGSFSSTTATHELYHALAGRWSLGNKDPANRSIPNRARAYEEVTADLFARCGQLLATATLARDSRSASIVINDERFEGELDQTELAGALELLSRDAGGSWLLADLLGRTVLASEFGEDGTIVLDSPEGENVLARCRDAAADPMRLASHFADMVDG